MREPKILNEHSLESGSGKGREAFTEGMSLMEVVILGHISHTL